MLITTVTKDRKQIFKHSPYAHEAIEALYRTQHLRPFFLHGFVIMPNHCHFLMFVPAPGSISSIMNCYKTGVSAGIGIGVIWQRRFHIRLIDNGIEALRYIHMNPVRAGLCDIPSDYPWSSASGKWDVSDIDCW